MAEGKKREYNRATCKERLRELLKRAEEINSDCADYPYRNHIETIVLFGSLINTDKDKVHDIDIYIQWDDNRMLMYEFYQKHYSVVARKYHDLVDQMFGEWLLTKSYLKNSCGIFSIHSNVDDGDAQILPVVAADKYLVLMQDYKAHYEALEEIP